MKDILQDEEIIRRSKEYNRRKRIVLIALSLLLIILSFIGYLK